MKHLLALLFGAAGLVAALFTGFLVGHREGQFQAALQENKIAAANLMFDQDKLSPQLKEYLKTRIYSNIERNYPSKPGYLRREEWDFGTVDRGVLRDIATFKEYSTYNWDDDIKKK